MGGVNDDLAIRPRRIISAKVVVVHYNAEQEFLQLIKIELHPGTPGSYIHH